MANKPSYKKILEHPDREEIISKLAIAISSKDINEWLRAKYTNVGEEKFVLSEKMLKTFKDTYLDFYTEIQQDIGKTKQAVKSNVSEDLELAVRGNSAYKDAMLKIANNELDVNQMISRMAINIELRVSQIFDIIQDNPNDINTKIDRVLIEYVDALGGLLDKAHKFQNPTNNIQFTQNNVNIQVDSSISVFHDVIKEVLSQMDLESSLYFMEVFNDKMSKLKMPDPSAPLSPELKMAEVQLLNQTINQKINE